MSEPCLCKKTYLKNALVPKIKSCNCDTTLSVRVANKTSQNKRKVKIILSNNTIEENKNLNSTVGFLSINEKDSNQRFSFKIDYENQYDNDKFIIKNNTIQSNYVFDYFSSRLYTIKVHYEGKKFSGEQEFQIIIKSKNESESIQSGSDVEVSFKNSELALKFENISSEGDVSFNRTFSNSDYGIYNIQSTCEFDGNLEITINRTGLNSQSAIFQLDYDEDSEETIFKNITSQSINGQIKGIIAQSQILNAFSDGGSGIVNTDVVVLSLCETNIFTYSTCTSGGNSTLNCGGTLTPQYDDLPCPGSQTRVATGISLSGSSSLFIGSDCGCWTESSTDIATIVDLVMTVVPIIAGPKAAVCAISPFVKEFFKDKGRQILAKQIAIRTKDAAIAAARASIQVLNQRIQSIRQSLVLIPRRISSLRSAEDTSRRTVINLEMNVENLRNQFRRFFGFSYSPESRLIIPSPRNPNYNRYMEMSGQIDRIDDLIAKKNIEIENISRYRRQQENLERQLTSELENKQSQIYAKLFEIQGDGHGTPGLMQQKEELENLLRNLTQEVTDYKNTWESAKSTLIASGAAAASAVAAINTINVEKTCESPKTLNETTCECECPDPLCQEPDCCTSPTGLFNGVIDELIP